MTFNNVYKNKSNIVSTIIVGTYTYIQICSSIAY